MGTDKHIRAKHPIAFLLLFETRGFFLNLIPCRRLDGPVRLSAKIRYRMAERPCTEEQTGEESIRLTFDQPQRAITPGQTVVLYDGGTVVGGAVIDRPLED